MDIAGPPTAPTNPAQPMSRLVNPCVPGLTPLMLAARCGHVMAVALLIDAQARPDARESSGMQALHFAAMRGCFQTCAILVGAGASSTATDKLNRTAFNCLPYEHIANDAERQAWSVLLVHNDATAASCWKRGNQEEPRGSRNVGAETSRTMPRPPGDVGPSSVGSDAREMIVVPL